MNVYVIECPRCGFSISDFKRYGYFVCPSCMMEFEKCEILPKLTIMKGQKEICICAAIQCTDGTIIKGHQHRDCRDGAVRRGKMPAKEWDAEGFITSQNRFVDREEAFRLMQAVNWKSKNSQGYQLCGWLYSEDLY